MYLRQAISRALEDSGLPIVTEHTFYVLVQPILASATYGGERVQRVPAHWSRSQLRAMIRTLVKTKALAPDEDFRAGVWHVVGALTAASAEDAICLVDPFAYVSHLSAMQRYGITDRSPEALHVTTATRSLWTALRDRLAHAERADDAVPDDDRPPLVRIGFAPVVRRRPVNLHESRHPAEPQPVAGEYARIASIGRVFVDMLDQPQLCGGIRHVLDCFDREAETWLDEIVAAVDAYPSPIVKVRAGYILDEMMGFSSDAVLSWLSCAQRGGSRKLDPHAPYGQRFSEKWMIALNV